MNHFFKFLLLVKQENQRDNYKFGHMIKTKGL
jgi:hypothetical protein